MKYLMIGLVMGLSACGGAGTSIETALPNDLHSCQAIQDREPGAELVVLTEPNGHHLIVTDTVVKLWAYIEPGRPPIESDDVVIRDSQGGNATVFCIVHIRDGVVESVSF